MDNTVFVLKGRSNVGKSTVIRKVYELLIRKYKGSTEEYLDSGSDIRVVLTINKIKVGIESQGDIGEILDKSLELFLKVRCKIIICATRTRGQTVNTIENLKTSNHEIFWFEQVPESDKIEQEVVNLRVAKKIFGEVEKVLDRLNKVTDK
jgi:hypothetical protein